MEDGVEYGWMDGWTYGWILCYGFSDCALLRTLLVLPLLTFSGKRGNFHLPEEQQTETDVQELLGASAVLTSSQSQDCSII